MRTQDEILGRYKERKEDDIFGFEVGEYVSYMDYEHAKELLKKETTKKEWERNVLQENTKEAIIKTIKDYVPFAKTKAEDGRGISAHRSIQHFIAWLWLAKENELLSKVQREYETNYHD